MNAKNEDGSLRRASVSIAGQIATALVLLVWALSCGAAPIKLWCPWSDGQEWQAGSPGSYYGQPPWHSGKNYYAVDFNWSGCKDCDCGQPILAAADGWVREMGYSSASGYSVRLQHSENKDYWTYYLHLVKDPKKYPGLSIGQKVRHGTVIGMCGFLGKNSDGCHLHFMLYKAKTGQSVKPSPMSGKDIDANPTRITSNNEPCWCPPIINVWPSQIVPKWYTTDKKVSWIVTDKVKGIDKIRYWWNGEGKTTVDLSGCPQTHNSDKAKCSPQMRQGKNVFHIYAQGCGDRRSCPVEVEYWLDSRRPTIDVTPPFGKVWINNTPNPNPNRFCWNVMDPPPGSGLAKDEQGRDKVTVIYCGPNHVISRFGCADMRQGKRVAVFTATDAAGNKSTVSGEWWFDSVKPTVAWQLNPTTPDGPKGCYKTRPKLTVTSTDSGGLDASGIDTIQYSLDCGKTWLTYPPAGVILPEGGHQVTARAKDRAGNWSAPVVCQNVVVGGCEDDTAPQMVSVDCPETTWSLECLSASWEAEDAETGVAEYKFSIGSAPGEGDVKEATSTGTLTSVTACGLELEMGETYYFNVRARNGIGIWSEWKSSEGTTVVPPPTALDVFPSLNSGGLACLDEYRLSDHFLLLDTIGQLVVGASQSEHFLLEHGYWH